jgi:peroxin-19
MADVLDEFAATKIDSSSHPAHANTNTADTLLPSSSAPGRPADDPAAAAAAATAADPFSLSGTAPGGGGEMDEVGFAQELQAGMADLLSELDSSPEMQKQFEDMLRELGAATGAPDAGSAGGVGTRETAAEQPSTTGGANMSFQDSIRRTMERMQESGEAAGAAAEQASQGDADFMAALLREMEAGELGGAEGEEDFSKVLMGMMEQLTNREILYEPMKELDDKFPEWLEKNKDKLPEAEYKRYETQQTLVREIVGKFEVEDYSDENVEYRKFIVDRMQQVCDSSSFRTSIRKDYGLTVPCNRCSLPVLLRQIW